MTANQYLKSKEPNTHIVPEEFLQEYTKIKCKELLGIVAEKARAGMNFNFTGNVPYVDKDSILNAVDLDEFIA